MAEKEIKIEKIKAKLLYKFSNQFYACGKNDDLIPIGKRRAIAFTNNPCADNDDIGLLAAYIEEVKIWVGKLASDGDFMGFTKASAAKAGAPALNVA